jgi:hypothetical protein
MVGQTPDTQRLATAVRVSGEAQVVHKAARHRTVRRHTEAVAGRLGVLYDIAWAGVKKEMCRLDCTVQAEGWTI